MNIRELGSTETPRAGKARYTQSLAAISLQIPVARSNHTLTVWASGDCLGCWSPLVGCFLWCSRWWKTCHCWFQCKECSSGILWVVKGISWHDWFSSSLQVRIVEVGRNLRFPRFCRFPHIGFKYDDIFLTRLDASYRSVCLLIFFTLLLGWTVFKTWVALLWIFIVLYHRYHS